MFILSIGGYVILIIAYIKNKHRVMLIVSRIVIAVSTIILLIINAAMIYEPFT